MSQSNCRIKVASDATVGERRLKLKLDYKFNSKDLSIERPLLVTVGE